jgi:hypothetical protein
MTAAKRHRDPLLPKPILCKPILLASLKCNGIRLKEKQVELFYQQLHRSGYPNLNDFVSELRGAAPTNNVTAINKGDVDNDVCSVSITGSISQNSLPTKNAVSSRPNRLAQLPKAFLDFLSIHSVPDDATNVEDKESFATLTSKVQSHRTSKDGSTTKIAVELQDGHVVESVLMRHAGSRATLCVSSQVGCAMGCTFCATGTMGIRGNLTSGEILEQLVHASRILASTYKNSSMNDAEIDISVEMTKRKKPKRFDLIRNVVFMGMGEVRLVFCLSFFILGYATHSNN